MDDVQLQRGNSNDFAWLTLDSKKSRGNRKGTNRGEVFFVVRFGTFQRFEDVPDSDGEIVNERDVKMGLIEFRDWMTDNPEWHVVASL
jgi:hypothetical protein